MTAAAMNLGAPRRTALREFLSAVQTIMVKELRSRMRGRRAFIVLTVYLGLLALITYGVYVVVSPNVNPMGAVGFGNVNASAIIGQSIFITLSIFQTILVAFIAPAFTAGQISLEREKQTLDLLVSTPMRPGAIVVGKLAAALAFVVLMIVAAIPITAIVLMYGGASVDDIVRQQVVLLATALVLGAIGIFYSALIKRTQAATVLTYITMLAMTLGTVMLFTFWTAIANQPPDGGFRPGPPRVAPEQILYVNPGVAMLDVVGYTEPGGGSGVHGFLRELRGQQGFGGVDAFGNPRFDETAGGYWWPRIVATFGLLALLLTLASMRLVVPAGMRWAFGRRRKASRPGAAVAAGDQPGATLEELDPDAPMEEPR